MIAFSMEIAKEPPFFIAEVVNLKDVVLDSKSIHVKIVKCNVSSASKLIAVKDYCSKNTIANYGNLHNYVLLETTMVDGKLFP